MGFQYYYLACYWRLDGLVIAGWDRTYMSASVANGFDCLVLM